jgi:hypothetical protein
MKFFIASTWKNKETVKSLSDKLVGRGFEVYSFIESGANLATGTSIEEEPKVFGEALRNWENDPRIRQIFDSEIQGLRESDALVLIEPAGHSSLLEAGVAYGMGKKVALIGRVEQPEIVYFICDRFYPTMEDFLDDVDNFVRTAGKRRTKS